MKKKNKYDTSVVLLYLIGKEDLLPVEFRKTIPSSTISDWRKADYTSYIGHEFRHLFVDNSDYLLLKRKYEATVAALKSIIKAWLCVQPLLLTFFKDARTNNSYQKQIVAAIGHLKKTIGLGTALKVFGISHTLFSVWCDVVRKNCGSSLISLCVKKHPRQLHRRETEKIRMMLASATRKGCFWSEWSVPVKTCCCMKRFFKALSTKNIYETEMRCKKHNAFWIFSVTHPYPWRVAPQQSSLPFRGGIAKLF